jgi:thioester reductase-like protein
MTRYLVTGAQGFTGRYVVAELLRESAAAYVIGTGRALPRDGFTVTSTPI